MIEIMNVDFENEINRKKKKLEDAGYKFVKLDYFWYVVDKDGMVPGVQGAGSLGEVVFNLYKAVN